MFKATVDTSNVDITMNWSNLTDIVHILHYIEGSNYLSHGPRIYMLRIDTNSSHYELGNLRLNWY